jgi:L-ascorbate metabolism protein UlaG (beta-lactamase superfamily)
MNITYYGHSCFGIEVEGIYIITDPFIRYNELASKIDIDTVKADYILQTHGHEDHYADTEYLALRTGAKVISNWEIHSFLNGQGILNTHPMNIGGSWTFPFGSVKAVNATHSSSMPENTYGGNPMGFLISAGGKQVYFSGDTGLTMDMKLIPLWAKLDLAILPIGDNFTMGYQDAAIAAEFVECEHVLGSHFDTFGFIKIDHEKAIQHFSSKGKKLTLLEIGDSITI